MMNQDTKFILLSFCALLFSININAQQPNICRLSPDGVYVLLSNAGASPKMPYHNITGYVVSRADGNSTAYREIARVTSPLDLQTFKNLAGENLVNQIKTVKKLNSDDALWNYIVTHPKLEDYEFLVLNPRLGLALGAYYLDESLKNSGSGIKYKYQVQYLQQNGDNVPASSGEVVTGTKTSSAIPEVFKVMESDTLIAVHWKSTIVNSEEIFFANVYRQTGGSGPFELDSVNIMVNRDADSLHFYWQEKVVPEVLYRYYIVPTDLFGNPGSQSDTINVISVSFEATPLLNNVTAKDTTGGIHIQWSPLPVKDYWTGVMVERSRDSRGNFIVLDTVSAFSNSYLDRRALPNTAYYYRLKAVTVRLDQTPPSAVVSGDWRNEIMPPLPPNNLRGSNDGEQVRLEWQANSEPDLFAYFVYRGTNSLQNMEVISPPLKEPFYLDTARNLNGRNSYLYAVRAVNLSEMVSDFSNSVSIRPQRFVAPPAPQGVSGFDEGVRIRLNWPDMSEMEETIIGYQVYRRELGNNQQLPENFNGLPASIAARQFGFELIANVPAPYFDDIERKPGKIYQYVVSSIDAVGTESSFSPVASIATENAFIAPPAEIAVRAISTGIVIEWGSSMQSGITGYTVYRRSRNEQNAIKIAELPIQQTNFVDETASADGLYFYSVSAQSEAGESKRSSEKGVKR